VPNRAGPEIAPLRLNKEEQRSLVAFLEALTDHTVDTRVPPVPSGP
jgi:hypothetical protein